MSGTKSGNRQDRTLPQEKQTFGLWLKHRRVALDMTQQVLAWQAACSARTIRQLEADGRRPSRQLAERLALALGIASNGRQVFEDFARGHLQTIPSTLAGPAAALDIEHPLPVPTSQLIGRDETSRGLTELLLVSSRPINWLVGTGRG